MKKLLILLLSVIFLSATIPLIVTASETTEQKENLWSDKTAVFVGDSITAGVGTTLENNSSASNYSGKVISILGDSISTFAGYIPTADGFNLTHRARYPQDNLLTDVNETWWMQVIKDLNAKLGVNDSWAGSRVINTISGNSGDQGENTAITSLTRITNLGSNGAPNVILFYGGTNDIGHLENLGEFDVNTAPTEPDLISTKWNSVAEAYVSAIMRMQYYYPSAQIIAMLPTFTSSYYTKTELAKYNEVFANICEHYGVTYIDLRNCGITTANLPDGIHPNATGMDYITNAVLDTLLNECEMQSGENVVHKVTHNLSNAKSSKSYYKGISNGKPFATAITGDDLTVTVTMGGVDITDLVYSNGEVNIPSVTGDLVITANGKEKPLYADHLQQLPDNFCAGTNLWSALKPENTYYTGSAWGNLASGLVYSVTFSVTSGDQIWANSFQAYGLNGNSSSNSSGIRVTWFSEKGVLKSASPNETYTEFKNNGYLTAPKGAVAVNIPMWTNNPNNAVYLLTAKHDYNGTTCTICEAELEQPEWESGTIASANGLNNANSTRLRTADYLRIVDYGGVSINFGYTMTVFAYDKDKNYLGTTSWLGNGVNLYLDKFQETYPNGIYFRIALRTLNSSPIAVDNLAETGVTFYAPNAEIPEQKGELEYENVGNIGTWQDGAIWNDKLFVLANNGTGAVFDLSIATKLSTLTLDKKDILKPHANSVCFGNTYYSEEDEYPLLYVNIYNNYASAEDRLEGTCCVYRITETAGQFTTKLVQVIRIGFTEDLNLWKSKENNGDARPYGNFVVDTTAGKLYAFVMRDADKVTRFFRFNLPSLTEGTYNETYDCNVITLESSQIEERFDTEYFNYFQGCAYYDGKIISAEGFSSPNSAEPALRIVDLTSKTVIKTYYLTASNLNIEPEVICVNPVTGAVYYSAADGILRILSLSEIHTHSYTTKITEPTCTEQGYSTHFCSTCENSFVDSYTPPTEHNYDNSKWGYKEGDGHARVCIVCSAIGHLFEHTSSGVATEDMAEICAVCEYVITPKLEHTHRADSEWEFNDSYHWYDCVANDGEELNKQEHLFGYWITVNGDMHKRVCKCEKEQTEPHAYGEWIVVKEATATEKGSKTKTCVCGNAITEEIPTTDLLPNDSSTTAPDSEWNSSEKNSSNSSDDVVELISCEGRINGATFGIMALTVACLILLRLRHGKRLVK